MKIKSLSCTQFAGVRDKNIDFADGINVIYGKNESGKSTMVNLLSRTLFQNAKIGKREKDDNEFRALYFPGEHKDGSLAGDFADGTLVFETDNGTYTLAKEWCEDEKNCRCRLSTPGGDVVRDQQKVKSILKEILLYGEGVYADMLLSSQCHTDEALKTLLDSSLKTEAKTEIADVVTRAFVESDGISINAIEEKIQGNIDVLVGKGWDIQKNAPAKKSNGDGRRQNSKGLVLDAYYAWMDAKDKCNKLADLEAELDLAATNVVKANEEMEAAGVAYDNFDKYANSLCLLNEHKKNIARYKEDLEKYNGVLDAWPGLDQKLARAKALQLEATNRSILDKYKAAKQIADKLAELENEITDKICPKQEEINAVKMAQRDKANLQNQLCGMNLTAAVQMLGGNNVEITSLVTGEPVQIADGIAAINEAVKITVPGVMEMQLAPADVDVASVQAEIDEKRSRIAEIFAKYSVDSTDALDKLKQKIDETNGEIKLNNKQLAMILQGENYTELAAKAVAITESVRTKELIAADCVNFGGIGKLNEYIAANNTIIGGYEQDYGSVENLQEKINDLQIELDKSEVAVSAIDDIPAEYATIKDPEQYRKVLKDALDNKQQKREAALLAMNTADNNLEHYKESVTENPAEEVEQREREFETQKALLAHWLHIKEVFLAQKERLNANPMEDIANSFAKYLGVISGGRVVSEFPNANKLEMQVYSENNLLDFGKLSEGTKDTVSLAFRLALLDHLFPNGGGIIVLDDPFTDMDVERTAEACTLVKECAKRHQLIFLTCREDYCDMLGGKKILL